MNLKADIAVALATTYSGLTEERKQEILATIKATRPEKLGELHAVFTQKGAGLTEPERKFYDAIVDLDGTEPSFAEFVPEPVTPVTPEEPTPINGKPASKSFAPAPQLKKPATNGNSAE